MSITKKQLGAHLINWIIAGVLFILFFIHSVGNQSMWDIAADNSFLFILLILPMVLAGVSLIKLIKDKIIHLGWVIVSSMTIGILIMINTIASSFGDLSSFFGYEGNNVGFLFWLIILLYIVALVYNSLALIGRADRLQKTLGEKSGPTLNNLKERTKRLQVKPETEDQKETRISGESEFEKEETKTHYQTPPHKDEVKPEPKF